MTLATVAFFDSFLLSLEAESLVARDPATMETKWKLAFDAKPVGLATGGALLVVDAAGTIHTIEGEKTAKTDGPHGAPTAFAALGETIALATAERVLVWYEGTKK